MKNRQTKLLKNLITVPSPSGFEDKIANFIRKQLLTYLPRTRVEIDFQKNVIAKIPGTSDQTIMIDAHADTIGFIVNNIDKEGLISAKYIGGGCKSILSARELIILSDKGKVNAVVDRKHAHLVDDENDESIEKVSEASIDIGIRKRRHVQRLIKIGDPIVYKPNFQNLIDTIYSGYGFDDKSGCYILLETIRNIVRSKKNPIPNLIFTFSAQEETGLTKAKSLVHRFKPDLFIEVDVTFATDYPEVDEKEAGRCELGKGLVIYRGVDIHKESVKVLESIARRNKIKIQNQASYGSIGYISTEITAEGKGTRALILGIPLRNMHSPVEIIDLKDLNEGAKLLKHFLVSRNIKRAIEK